MKKIVIIFLTVITLFSALLSCTSELEEVNKNPNSPTVVPAYGLFSGANKFLMDATRGDFSSGRMALPWVQYSAQRNYTEEDRFQFREGVNQSLYRDYYLAANDYKSIIDFNTNPETKEQNAEFGNNDNQIAAARVMLSYVFLQLVDSYGDVPYYSFGNKDPDFQALQLEGGIIKPKFASQIKIYTDLMKELKEASEMIVIGEDVFTKGDLLFGNAAKLKKFANSLRLRIANRVKGVVPGAEANITDAIASGVMTSNTDNVGVTYQADEVFPSPFYTSFYVSNRTDFAIANTFVDLLKGELGTFGVDPRLQKYAAPTTASKAAVRANTYLETSDLTKYEGMTFGIPSSLAASQRSNTSFWSSNVLKQDYKELFMEYAEVEFLLSENTAWNNTNYQNGVRASMERWGVDPSSITTYIGTLAPANKANVLTQKYIGLFMQPYEAWAEHRRTGYPNTLLKPGGTYPLRTALPSGATTYVFESLNNLTEMPTRFTYPVNLAQLNGNNYQAAVTALGGDLLTTKLIWDKN